MKRFLFYAVPLKSVWSQASTTMAGSASPTSKDFTTNTKNAPPFLIVHGTLDRLVPFNQSQLLVVAHPADHRRPSAELGGGHCLIPAFLARLVAP